MAQQLSGYCNVIYTSAIPFHSRDKTFTHVVKGWRLENQKKADQLSVLNFYFLPSWHSVSIRNWNHRKWVHAISDYIEREGISIDILWVSSPEQFPFWKQISARLVCYDCMDNYESFFPQLLPIEQELFRRVDTVFVSASLLEEKARKYADDVHLVANGVEVAHFRSALENPCQIPVDMKSIPSPRIGYYGSIAHWMDYEILEELQKEAGLSIVLIGPVLLKKKELKRLTHNGRLFLLGPKPYRDLPSYLAHLSVCILPFKDTELTRAVDPVKVYEYLAAGKDVVATPLPSLAQHADLLTLASADKFCEAVQNLLRCPSPLEACKHRSAAMSVHSWKNRAEQIMTVFARKGI